VLTQSNGNDAVIGEPGGGGGLGSNEDQGSLGDAPDGPTAAAAPPPPQYVEQRQQRSGGVSALLVLLVAMNVVVPLAVLTTSSQDGDDTFREGGGGYDCKRAWMATFKAAVAILLVLALQQVGQGLEVVAAVMGLPDACTLLTMAWLVLVLVDACCSRA
jgi:hypothetical protein